MVVTGRLRTSLKSGTVSAREETVKPVWWGLRTEIGFATVRSIDGGDCASEDPELAMQSMSAMKTARLNNGEAIVGKRI